MTFAQPNTAPEPQAPPARREPMFAAMLPPLSTDEFLALEQSIARDGVRDAIVVDETGAILDGHHRFKIAPDAPRRVVAGLSTAQKLAFVISSNFHRRNLSPDQKKALHKRQVEIAFNLKEEGFDQAEIGAMLGVAQNTVSGWLVNNIESDITYDNRVKVPKDAAAEILERWEAGDTQEQIAADFGITRERVSQIAAEERKRRAREESLRLQAQDIIEGRVTAATGPFDVIVIDPPWPYGTQYDPGSRRAANPYPEMPLDQIAALDVAARCAPDCVLWLWTTHKFMRHSFPLLDAWGFEDKVILTWAKNTIGLGVWLRSQSEFCIMAVRGSPQVQLTNQSTVLQAPVREHSRKPDEFFAMVESLCTGPRRYDWFAREPRAGWLVGGNDTAKFTA